MSTLRVDKSGPVFDGRAAIAVDDFTSDATEAIAQRGVNYVKTILQGVLKNPTGYYERHIVTDRQMDDRAVTDSGVVYGPWLEGVSSRNQSTRFKGYLTFRTASQRLDSTAEGIAEGMLSRYVRRMN